MLEAVFDTQREDGMVPHMSTPSQSSGITQPPVLALAASLVDEVAPDDDWMAGVYPALCRYVEWDLANRDSDGAGLLEWAIEDDVDCRGGESGMDNSPRFDCAAALDAVDFNTYAASECDILSAVAQRLGKADESRQWAERHTRLCGLMNERLWREQDGLYVDCFAETGLQMDIPAASGFLPLICGAPSDQQARRLARHLSDPRTFGTPLPVATIAACDTESYAKDMWRGPAWVNVNWLIARGFERYGLSEAAAEVRDKTLAEVERWHQQYGVFFEYYDDRGDTPPPQLLRKGRCIPGAGAQNVIHDYGWTATLYVDMVLGGHEAT